MRAYLAALEVRDVPSARRLLAPGFTAIYPGDRRFAGIDEVVTSGHGLYRNVVKTFEREWLVPVDADTLTSANVVDVFVAGRLAGQWWDAEPFAGVRFIDQFQVANGLILEQHVWNDLAATPRKAGTARAAKPYGSPD